METVMNRTAIPPDKRKMILSAYVLLGMAVILSVVLILYVGCLLVGKCYLRYDSAITEIGVCLDTDYQPVVEVPSDTEQLFLCGKVEGTTPHRGALYLFYENEVIYSADADQPPGTFFQRLPVDKIRQPGSYRVEIWYAKRVLASTEFSVISQ
jgi:hypothetical protein